MIDMVPIKYKIKNRNAHCNYVRDMVALKYKMKNRIAHRNYVRDTVALEAQDVRGGVHVSDQEACFHLERRQELM